MSETKNKLRYRVKGRINNLKPKSVQGKKIAVECLNLETKVVRYFESVTEASHYLQEQIKSDRKFLNQISLHVRRSSPVPFRKHLWRVSIGDGNPWPDFDHLDLELLTSDYVLLPYPIYGLDVRTGVIHTFHSCKEVAKTIPISPVKLNNYMRKKFVYKKAFRFASTKEGLLTPKKARKPRMLYIYTVLNTVSNEQIVYHTVLEIARSGVSTAISIKSKFHHCGSDVIYVGDDNLYRITRTVFHGKKTYNRS